MGDNLREVGSSWRLTGSWNLLTYRQLEWFNNPYLWVGVQDTEDASIIRFEPYQSAVATMVNKKSLTLCGSNMTSSHRWTAVFSDCER